MTLPFTIDHFGLGADKSNLLEKVLIQKYSGKRVVQMVWSLIKKNLSSLVKLSFPKKIQSLFSLLLSETSSR